MLKKNWKKFISLFRGSKYTLMIIPGTQKNIKNYHISIFNLYAYSFVFLTILSFSIITLGRYIYYNIREEVFLHQHNRFVKEMSHLMVNSGRIMVAQQKFNTTLNGLLTDLGLRSAINLSVGLGGPLVILDHNQPSSEKNSFMNIPGLDTLKTDSDELNLLQDLSNNAQGVEKKIHLLATKVKTFESIVRYIPSIWPLKGEGEILESKNNGVMRVSTVPFTPVIATAEGKIAGINFLDKGIKVTILHKYQFISTYNGLFEVPSGLKKGAIVHKGEIIGYVAKNKGNSVLSYGLFIGNRRAIYPLDPLGFSYMGR